MLYICHEKDVSDLLFLDSHDDALGIVSYMNPVSIHVEQYNPNGPILSQFQHCPCNDVMEESDALESEKDGSLSDEFIVESFIIGLQLN